MPETFLILLAGGVMLASAVPRPADVTLHWLRLAGILALSFCGLGLFFYFRREPPMPHMAPLLWRIQMGLLLTTTIAVLGQLAFAQVGWRGAQRALALTAFLLAVLGGSNLLHELMFARGTALLLYMPPLPPKAADMLVQTLACAGVAAMTGLVLMAMLLGHAYLTASKMTMAPFRRLNLALAVAIGLRAVLGAGAAYVAWRDPPVDLLWAWYGLQIGTRWLVGLVVPAVFVYMTHDCVRRRATQSATGILYVAGVLVFIGELIALWLTRETALAF